MLTAATAVAVCVVAATEATAQRAAQATEAKTPPSIATEQMAAKAAPAATRGTPVTARMAAEGRQPVLLLNAEASRVCHELVIGQTHCLVWIGQGYESGSTCTRPAPLTIMAVANEVQSLQKACRPAIAFVAVRYMHMRVRGYACLLHRT